MNREEIEKLLLIIFEDARLKDDDIIDLIYTIMEQIEKKCYGIMPSVYKQRFDRLYKRMFEDIFIDLIANNDWFDEFLLMSLKFRKKTIVDEEESNASNT